MIDLLTHIKLENSKIQLSYDDSILLLGSCFSESMGSELREMKFQIESNPFGVLYNPLSIAKSLYTLMQKKEFHTQDLFNFNGMFHSFSHHSIFSDVEKTKCIEKINERLSHAASFLLRANRIFITFGTAYAYRAKGTGEVVANCHKLPDSHFDRYRLTVDEIVAIWDELIVELLKKNNQLQFIFTVSPVRHLKDGAHQNQISKSILFLSIEQLQAKYSKQIAYFPSYELMMDELRDYRFYADDKIHPSTLAIQYIWERFIDVFTDDKTRRLLNNVEEIQRALNHKPFHPNTQAYKIFMEQTIKKIEQIHSKMPYLCFTEELEKLNRLGY